LHPSVSICSLAYPVSHTPSYISQALYNAYYENQLVVMKEELPGLKLSQYKERIFELWKRSPENPDNQGK
jgi:hypothetical protein